MGARERWGYCTLYADGTINGKTDAPEIADWEYSENDGARFMRRGPERLFHIRIREGTTPSQLEEVLKKKPDINPDFKKRIERMIEEGKLYSADFDID